MHTPDELLEMAGYWMKTLAVVRCDKESPETFEGICGETLGRLTDLAEPAHMRWTELEKFIIAWALNRRHPEERSKLAETAVKIQGNSDQRNELRAMSQTIDDYLMEQGRIEGKRSSLGELLQLKFPAKFDQTASDRIQITDDSQQLSQWFKAAVQAESWKAFKTNAGWADSKSAGEDHKANGH